MTTTTPNEKSSRPFTTAVGSTLKRAGKNLQHVADSSLDKVKQSSHDTAQKLKEGGKQVVFAVTPAGARKQQQQPTPSLQSTIVENMEKQEPLHPGKVALVVNTNQQQQQQESAPKLKHSKVVDGIKHATDKVVDAGKAVAHHIKPKTEDQVVVVSPEEGGDTAPSLAATTVAIAKGETMTDEEEEEAESTVDAATGVFDKLAHNKVVDGIKHTKDKIASTTKSVLAPVKTLTGKAPAVVEQTEANDDDDKAIIEVKPTVVSSSNDDNVSTASNVGKAMVLDKLTHNKVMDGLKHNKVVDGIKHTTDKLASTTKTVGKTVLVDPIQNLTHGKKKKDRGVEAPEEPQQDGDLPPVPPDEVLKKMDIILTKRIKGLTVQQFYDTVWKEDPPLYKPWLETSGKKDVVVQQWQRRLEGPYTGTWDGEEYDQQRTVTFRFTRTTHLYTGPPVADVKHTQYCRLVPDECCVLSMTIEMQGIPFADCFNVQIRWVTTQLGSNTDLRVQVGLHVNFIQQTILAGKIRSGTSEETTKTQRSLLETVKETCTAVGGGEDVNDDYEDDDDDDTDVTMPPCWNQFAWLQNLMLGGHSKSDDAVSQQTEAALAKLQRIKLLYNKSDDERSSSSTMIESELTDIHASLDKILQQVSHGAV